MYYCFSLFGKFPNEYRSLPYGERVVVRAFLREKIKEANRAYETD